MLVTARLMNSQLDVPDFFCNYLNWHMSVDVRQAYENKRFMQPLDLPLNMDDWQPSSSTERRPFSRMLCFALRRFSVPWTT